MDEKLRWDPPNFFRLSVRATGNSAGGAGDDAWPAEIDLKKPPAPKPPNPGDSYEESTGTQVRSRLRTLIFALFGHPS
jgi:hypothetical protein